MDARERQIKDLFESVIDLDKAERTAELDARCPPELRADVERLIVAAEGSERAMDLDRLIGDLAETSDTLVTGSLEVAPFDELDEFRILRKIGEGGMAAVYLAEDTSPMQRLVAIKVLAHATATQLARFMDEARTLAHLKHPGIVTAYKTGLAGGAHYIVMEYVDGMTLESRLANETRGDEQAVAQRIGSREYLMEQAGLIAEIADALDHAHRRDIIHRDVKPSNILIDENNRARLTDFGIAKNLRGEGLTEPGIAPGTVPYMSPEQARAMSERVDRRSDVFSLGAVLYELLTLQRPFQGRSVQDIVHQVVWRDPRSPRSLNPGISKDLEIVCLKALEKDQAHRYQLAAQFAGDLRAIQEGLPPLARRRSLARSTRIWFRRHRLRALSAAVLLLAVVAGVLGSLVVQRHHASLCHVELRAPGTVRTAIERLDETTLEFQPIDRRVRGSRSFRLTPGVYRFTSIDRSGGFAELTRTLSEAGDRAILEPAILPTAGVIAGMVRVGSGPHAVGSARMSRPLFRARSIVLDPFLIDPTEVSNREYLEFVRATGHRLPTSWVVLGDRASDRLAPEELDDPFDATMAQLPVVGVTQEDARAYAEWRGKRLPTRDEWEAAARAPDGRLLPWGEAELSGLAPGVTAEALEELSTSNSRSLYGLYARFARPVGGDPLLSNPIGLFHMFGNVQEFVDTVLFDPIQPVVKGRYWGESGRHTDLSHTVTMPPGMTSSKIGFRCAKSAAPAAP